MVLPADIRVAARGGYVDTVRAWLDADAAHDINDVAAAEDDPRLRGCGLLFSAVQYPFPGDADNSEAMVSYLVARGADVRHRPLGTGPTPLHMACSRALTGAVRELVRAGADVNEDIADGREARPDFLTPFTLVIATQLPARELKRVGALCAGERYKVRHEGGPEKGCALGADGAAPALRVDADGEGVARFTATVRAGCERRAVLVVAARGEAACR